MRNQIIYHGSLALSVPPPSPLPPPQYLSFSSLSCKDIRCKYSAESIKILSPCGVILASNQNKYKDKNKNKNKNENENQIKKLKILIVSSTGNEEDD